MTCFETAVSAVFAPPTAPPIAAARAHLETEIRDTLRATVALALTSAFAVALLAFYDLPFALRLGMQEIIAITAFATCTYLMYERASFKLIVFEFDTLDASTQREWHALLNRRHSRVRHVSRCDGTFPKEREPIGRAIVQEAS